MAPATRRKAESVESAPRKNEQTDKIPANERGWEGTGIPDRE